jgi:hypothetical protein
MENNQSYTNFLSKWILWGVTSSILVTFILYSLAAIPEVTIIDIPIFLNQIINIITCGFMIGFFSYIVFLILAEEYGQKKEDEE